MSHDPQKPADPHHPVAWSKGRLIQGAFLFFFVLLVLIASIAWRQLDPSIMAHLYSTAFYIKPLAQVPVQSAEISEQTRASSGIILASIVIVLIILGGTFGATRRKPQ